MSGSGAHLMRWSVLGALSLATAVIFAVSLRGNYLYGYSLGQSDEKRFLFAWANVAADVWKAFGLIAVTLLWRTRRHIAVIASVTWLLCLVFGINSALGIYAHDRAAVTGSREVDRANYEDLQKDLEETQAKLGRLGMQRTTAEIDAAMHAVLTRPVIIADRLRGTVASLSQSCARIDARTATSCADLAKLAEERAAAQQAELLTARVDLLRAEVRAARTQGGTHAADPVGDLYAWFTRGWLTVRDVGFAFSLSFGLLIEVVSAFGPATIAAYAEASRGQLRRAVTGPDAPWRGEASNAEALTSSVMAWMAARTVPGTTTRSISLVELHADYADWCQEHDASALALPTFARAFDDMRALPDLAGKIVKRADGYAGIALAEGDGGHGGSR